MLCLGRHWDARTFKYALRRTDVDGLPVPPIPPSLITLAGRVAADAATTLEADMLIINRYAKGGDLGLHQDKDKDERPETIARGVPVVSISLGDDADFRFRGAKKTDPLQTIRLRSGDAFVFGGLSRLAYHGVHKIIAGASPQYLDIGGRINLTFRQF